jgi:DNA-binding transcriptional MocR family regulator
MNKDSSIATVAGAIRAEAAGRPAGGRLPSTREFVRRLGVSPVTVSRALAVLVSEGTVITRTGEGSFVADRPARGDRQADDFGWQTLALGERRTSARGVLVSLEEPPSEEIPLASGYPHPSLLPVRALAAAMARAGRRPDAWQRPPVAGLDGLRAWFARSTGGQVDAADVIVTPGAQGALTAAFRALLPAGSVLLVESPTYPGALAVAAAAGIRIVPVPVDEDGIRPDDLAQAFAATGARAVYCQPTFQNPTGVVLSAERRAQVLGAAAAAGAFVVEDDYGRWLAHERPAPPPLITQDHDGRVVHVTSLTKPASPSLRVGALIARGPVSGWSMTSSSAGRCRRPPWNWSAHPRGRGTWRTSPGRSPPGGPRSRWPCGSASRRSRSRCCPGEARACGCGCPATSPTTRSPAGPAGTGP